MDRNTQSMVLGLISCEQVAGIFTSKLKQQHKLIHWNSNVTSEGIDSECSSWQKMIRHAEVIIICLPQKLNAQTLENISESAREFDNLSRAPMVIYLNASELPTSYRNYMDKMLPGILYLNENSQFSHLEHKLPVHIKSAITASLNYVMLLYIFSNFGKSLVNDIRLENISTQIASHHTLNALMHFQTDINEMLCSDSATIESKHTDYNTQLSKNSGCVLCAYKNEIQNETKHEVCLTSSLTDRQSEVLYWLKLGKSNLEISMILAISSDTVKFHVRNIYSKLGVYNRVQAAQVVVVK